ncbi:MAG: hypothetical protein ABIG84_03400 [archaeon]
MVEYHYNPDKKKTKLGSSEDKVSHFFEPLSKNKLGVAIVLVLLALVVSVGPKITGNLFYEDPEYTMLSQNPDFPHLSKQNANIELYKLRDGYSNLQSRFDGCESGLSSAQELYNTCNTQKLDVTGQLQIMNDNYNTCQSASASLKSDLDACNSEKSSTGVNLGVCNTNLNDKEAQLRQLEVEKAAILSNYASGVCCTLKQLSNPALRYYNVVNNRVVCSETEGNEFSC